MYGKIRILLVSFNQQLNPSHNVYQHFSWFMHRHYHTQIIQWRQLLGDGYFVKFPNSSGMILLLLDIGANLTGKYHSNSMDTSHIHISSGQREQNAPSANTYSTGVVNLGFTGYSNSFDHVVDWAWPTEIVKANNTKYQDKSVMFVFNMF